MMEMMHGNSTATRAIENMHKDLRTFHSPGIVCVACKELEAHRRCDKDQARCVLRPCKQLPAINKYHVVKAGYRLALFFFGWFNFLWYFVVFGRDYEELSAGGAPGTFSTVLVGKSDHRILSLVFRIMYSV